MKRRNKCLLTAAGLVSAAVLVSALDARLTVRRYEVDAPLEAPVRLALVSDLHSCRYGEGQARLLDALDRQSPDAVLLAGDILDDEMAPAPALQFLSAAAERWPCVYVSGNHEVWTGRLPEILSHIEALGVHVLQGGRITLTLRGASIDLLGLDDPAVGTSLYSRERDALAALPETGHFSILLAHRPERYPDYAPLNCDLILNGHAHGGQWRIPGLLNGLYAPNQGLFPAHAGGQYPRDGGQVQIVSRGLARESTLVPRVWNRPEVVIVDLIPAGTGS